MRIWAFQTVLSRFAAEPPDCLPQVIFVFVYQTTFFAACLLLDMRRQAANRVDWLCCIQTSRGPTRGCVGTFIPGGDNISQRLIGRYLPAAILHWAGKLVVMAITVGLLVLGVAGAVKVQQVKRGFAYQRLPAVNSLRQLYSRWLEKTRF